MSSALPRPSSGSSQRREAEIVAGSKVPSSEAPDAFHHGAKNALSAREARGTCSPATEDPALNRPRSCRHAAIEGASTGGESDGGGTRQTLPFGERGEVLLDGRLVWRDPAAQADRQVGLGTLLAAIGASEKQAAYMEKVLHPFVASMVLEAIRAVPSNPAAFCLLWLLDYLGVPGAMAAPVRTWLQTHHSDLGTKDFNIPNIFGPSTETSAAFEASETPMSSTAHGTILRCDSKKMTSTTDDEDRPRRISFSEDQKTEGRNQSANSRSNSRESRGRYSHSDSRDSRGMMEERAWVRRRTLAPPTTIVDMDEIVESMRKVPCIQESLDEEELRSLATFVQVRVYEPDAVLVHHGDVGSEVFVLQSGTCSQSIPQVVGSIGVGECFGESALLNGSNYASQTITASGDAHVVALTLNSEDLDGLGLLSKLMAKKTKDAKMTRRIRPMQYSMNLDSDLIAQAFPATSSTATIARRLSGYSASSEKPARRYSNLAKPAALKTENERNLIKQAVLSNRNMMELLSLNDAHLNEIVSRVTKLDVEAGHFLVTKGEMGDAFYVIADGVFEVLLDPDPEHPTRNRGGVAPRNLRIGDCFGELALLYDSPRSATVVPPVNSSVWVLELSQWRIITKMRSAERIDSYVSMLANIESLVAVVGQDSDHLENMGAALEEVYFLSGEKVTVEGDAGNTLYIIYEGACKAMQGGAEIGRMGRGESIGADALLHGEKYTSTVIVTSDTARVLALDKVTMDVLASGGSTRDLAESAKCGFQWQRRRTRGDSKESDQTSTFSAELDSFTFLGVLGCGSFAVVSLVQDTSSEQLYALKRMSKTAIADQGIQDMVVAEKNTLMQMKSDFVVSLVCTFKDEDSIYFLMRPAMGGELFELFTNKTDWFGSKSHAAFYAVCVALGLDHMHSKKIIHRDIKLENILLDSAGYAIITDMGLAKTVVGKTYTVCGTSDYLAPETLRQVGHNRAVDWWALGVSIFVMMSGRSPFDADDVMQIYRNIVKGFRKDHFPSKFETNLVDLIKTLCKKKPEDRIAMLPGGIKNLKAHPWLRSSVDWDAVAKRTFKPPYHPEQKSVEDFRKTLKQHHDVKFEPYESERTGWDVAF